MGTNKTIIYVVAIISIVVVLSASLIYIYHPGQASTQSSSGSISIVDDEGYVTTLTSLPQRIVSLAPSCTQILFAIGDGSKVVGVTTYDDYPYNFTEWAAEGKITIDGGYGTPNMEAIASLRPDLIFTDNINDASLPSMRASGYKVIVLNPSTVTGIEQDIMIAGRATGAETDATSLVASMSNTISNIQAKIAAANITAQPTVYYEIWNNPYMSVGESSWISDAITKAGGVNIFENISAAYPTVSSETIVQLNPSVILLPSGAGGGMGFYGSIADVEARPGWNTISAVQNNRIYVIDQDLFSEPAPRVSQLVQDIAACLYPQLFNSTSS